MSELDLAKAPHLQDPARRLRSGAWLLQRSWRHPHRLPAGWRSERFARSVDRARTQLRPIGTLSALGDSFAREGLHLASIEAARAAGSRRSTLGTSPLEVAHVTRWIELDRGGELHGRRILRQRAAG